MRFRMLGPLLVYDGSSWSAIRAAQQRLVAALLLLEAGRAVPVERLVDELWGERPPPTAAATVRGYVMRLRRLIGGGAGGPLVTRGLGYELVIEDTDVDARVFAGLVASERRDLEDGRPATAAVKLVHGLALWRGPALADVPASPAVTAEAERLAQLRLAALEDWLDVQLHLGRHADVVEEAQRLVAEHPLRERLWARLMLAQYRCGRRAEALAAYQVWTPGGSDGPPAARADGRDPRGPAAGAHRRRRVRPYRRRVRRHVVERRATGQQGAHARRWSRLGVGDQATFVAEENVSEQALNRVVDACKAFSAPGVSVIG